VKIQKSVVESLNLPPDYTLSHNISAIFWQKLLVTDPLLEFEVVLTSGAT